MESPSEQGALGVKGWEGGMILDGRIEQVRGTGHWRVRQMGQSEHDYGKKKGTTS